jgi:hypothetical protein
VLDDKFSPVHRLARERRVQRRPKGIFSDNSTVNLAVSCGNLPAGHTTNRVKPNRLAGFT